MKLLVTGGAGYVGSHTCVELLEADHEVTVIDNLSNSKKEALDRVEQITGKSVVFHKIDLLDKKRLSKIFSGHDFEAVVHFAGLKAVGESVAFPLRYYHNNVSGTANLCEVMRDNNVRNIIFSSSATVYGDPDSVPITEDFPLRPKNPYGWSKFMIEQMLRDLHTSDDSWNALLLRYFNPVGAHCSGTIGEDPNGIPSNLMPFISQVAVGKREELCVFGNDYPTPDGTGIRDYIHVVDLAVGHLKAIEKLGSNPGVVAYNLGTGKGLSVLDVVKAFEKASGKEIRHRFTERRPGDASECYADPSLAARELDWQTERGIDEMCADSWNWQSKNPEGY